jgi:hypothetical protein
MVAYRIARVFAAALVLAAAGVCPAKAASPSGDDRPLASGDGRAQTLRPDGPVRRLRPRVEIQPERPLQRECVTTTHEVWRPYWGYVVMPSMRCWWVRQ